MEKPKSLFDQKKIIQSEIASLIYYFQHRLKNPQFCNMYSFKNHPEYPIEKYNSDKISIPFHHYDGSVYNFTIEEKYFTGEYDQSETSLMEHKIEMEQKRLVDLKLIPKLHNSMNIFWSNPNAFEAISKLNLSSSQISKLSKSNDWNYLQSDLLKVICNTMSINQFVKKWKNDV